MAFPSTLSTFNRPNPTDRLNSPSHSALHNTVSSAVGQIEAVIGVEGNNSVVGSLEYLIKSPASNGGGHVQTAVVGGTGQITFAKGDLLVATNPSTLAKLAVGLDTQVLQADSSAQAGVKWGNPALNVQSFLSTSASFVWNKPSVASRVFVEIWGAGGSGGSGTTNKPGGGGGGAYNSGWFVASALGTTETVSIGVGGVAVSGAQSTGNDGTATVFGKTASLLSAFGGQGGQTNGGGAGSSGGQGGGQLGVGMPATPLNGSSNLASSTASATLYSNSGGGDGVAGGATVYGGGGGGGARGSTLGAGGTSQYGGNGGQATQTSSAASGVIPGGGGGAITGAGLSGPGASGKAVITTFG